MNDSNLQSEKVTREERKVAQAAADRARATKEKMRSAFKYLGFLGVLALMVVGLVLLSKGSSTNTPIVLPSEVTDSDWKKGNPEASVVLVEYGDFQCPACAGISPTINQLLEEYGDRMTLVFRHLPLISIHPNAEEGSWAVEAAGKQGKFFEMGNVLFAKQSEWGTLPNPLDAFTSYAGSLGLNTDQFIADYKSDDVRRAVSSSLNSARAAGLGSTPSFFLNGQQLQSTPRDINVWRSMIEDELAKESQAPEDGSTAAGTVETGTDTTTETPAAE